MKNIVAGKDAVSPIIAVIITVAITFVLSGGMYAWISNFGSGDGGTNVVFSLDQSGHGGNGTIGWVNYTVNAVGGHPGYEDITATLGGSPATIMTSFPQSMSEVINASGEINCGNEVCIITTHYKSASQLPGLRLNIRHESSNTLILSISTNYS